MRVIESFNVNFLRQQGERARQLFTLPHAAKMSLTFAALDAASESAVARMQTYLALGGAAMQDAIEASLTHAKRRIF
ncbi:MAG: hypothetical protein WB930_13815 [Syntrophobacteraceae bacterium]